MAVLLIAFKKSKFAFYFITIIDIYISDLARPWPGCMIKLYVLMVECVLFLSLFDDTYEV